jgi:hypothetical protein
MSYDMIIFILERCFIVCFRVTRTRRLYFGIFDWEDSGLISIAIIFLYYCIKNIVLIAVFATTTGNLFQLIHCDMLNLLIYKVGPFIDIYAVYLTLYF